MRFRFQTFVTQLKTSILTANRTIALPDASGTLQLWGDQPVSSPEGLILIYLDGAQLTISAGRATIPTVDNRTIAILPSSLTKILTTAWTPGTNQGGAFAGVVGALQTWHVFVIKNITTGVVDVGFDLSVTGANIPSGWIGRIIGSILTGALNNIQQFIQIGDRFEWFVAGQDYTNSNTTTTTTNLLALKVPTGINIRAFGRMYLNPSAILYASNPAVNANAVANATNSYTPFDLFTNTSAQIRYYCSVANITSEVVTKGFFHPRGT